MRYYFHLHNDIEKDDEEGRELSHADALLNAQAEARQMASESALHGHLNLSHFIEVTNDNGGSSFRVAFGDFITVIRQAY